MKTATAEEILSKHTGETGIYLTHGMVRGSDALEAMEEYRLQSHPSPVEYPEAIIANFQPASPMSAEQVEVLHAIMVLAEHGIPGYAFGDNEAACEMDNRLSEICRLASTTPSVKADGWVSVEDGLPEPLETVWLSNGKGFTSLGCRTELVDVGDDTYNWCWAQSNGIIYEEKGKIVSECEDDDLDVKFWQPLPAPPKQQL